MRRRSRVAGVGEGGGGGDRLLAGLSQGIGGLPPSCCLLPAAVVVELVVVDKLESMGLGASNLLAGITVEAADGLRPITVSEAQIICGP